MISRQYAYHGTPHGALAITGLPGMKAPFEPLPAGSFRVPNTNFYRAEESGGPADDLEAFGLLGRRPHRAADPARGPGHRRRRVPRAGAELRRLLHAASRLLPARAGDLRQVRRAPRLRRGHLRVRPHRLDVRLRRFGYVPDMITCAKAMTSGYSPIGATIVSDRIYEPFRTGAASFAHGYTFAGHPVSAAVALENLAIFEEEGLNERVRDEQPLFRASLERLKDLPIVGDVRGDGYFFGIELVKDKATKDDLRRRRVRAPAARVPLHRPVRGGPVLPRGRPRRPRHPAGSAAHDRRARVRRDREHPAGVLTEAWTRL